MPCPYANALGVPGEGFHTHFAGVAINDILGTLAIAGITSYVSKISFLRASVIWFTLAEILHAAFGVRTKFLEKLGIHFDCEADAAGDVKDTSG